MSLSAIIGLNLIRSFKFVYGTSEKGKLADTLI